MTLGLLLTSLALGIRHGVDWDHIAAITDLTSAADSRWQGLLRSFVYAIGHAAAVFVLGAAAIIFGTAIPAGVDDWMGRVVGATLVALGIYVLVQLIRNGRRFRLRSRWVLILDGTFAGMRRVRTIGSRRRIGIDHIHSHEHGPGDETEHDADARASRIQHDHSHSNEALPVDVAAIVGRGASPGPVHTSQHSHRHHHDLSLPESPFASYGGRTATGIGVLHGIGFESPTQIAVFVAATSVGGHGAGLVLLLAWVVGLLVANTGLALLASTGWLGADRSFFVRALLAVLVGAMSIVIGAMLLTGLEGLPAI